MLNTVPELGYCPTKLSINVLSGQQLPKPGGAQKGEIIDPYVILRINGHPDDFAEYKTKTVTDNGFNPIWNEVSCRLHVPIDQFCYFYCLGVSFQHKVPRYGCCYNGGI